MADPVVLIGTSIDDGGVVAVGLYSTAEEAKVAVQRGDVPGGCHYAVMTPQLGKTLRRIDRVRSNDHV